MISSIIHTLAWKHFFSVAKFMENNIPEHERIFFRGNALLLLLLMLFADTMESCQEAVRNSELLPLFIWSRVPAEHPSECFAGFFKVPLHRHLNNHPKKKHPSREKAKKDFIARFYFFYLYESSWTIWMCCVSCGISEFPSTRKWILNLSFVEWFDDESRKCAAHCSRRRHNGEFTLNSQRGLIENNFLLFAAGANLFLCKSRLPVRLLVGSHEIISQILLAHFSFFEKVWHELARQCVMFTWSFSHIYCGREASKGISRLKFRSEWRSKLLSWCCRAFMKKFYNIWREIHVKWSDFSCTS